MKIAILGAGGIGGYYGGLLARHGHDVCVLARKENLAALRDKGLEVRVPGDAFTVRVQASDDAKDFGRVEYAILAVKNYSLAELAPTAALLAAQGALIVPLLNGVEVVDRLVAGGVSREQLVGGLTAISVVRVAPGVFERRSPFQRVVLGELDQSQHERAQRINQIVQAFRQAGVDAEISQDITADLWRKFAFIASMAAACGLSRTAIGPLRATPLGHLLIERAVREVVSVARARKVALAHDEVERTMKTIDGLPEAMKPSLLIDLEAGRPTEIEDMSGAVSRLGKVSGVETPVHDTAAAAIGLSTEKPTADQR
ncbi:MAG TPA: ketopantoate reductase family protein [Candidatus Angelobacter sp.]|nr:ketopantoate reductase family protein [Candidatus Angelobacter sp.]